MTKAEIYLLIAQIEAKKISTHNKNLYAQGYNDAIKSLVYLLKDLQERAS